MIIKKIIIIAIIIVILIVIVVVKSIYMAQNSTSSFHTFFIGNLLRVQKIVAGLHC